MEFTNRFFVPLPLNEAWALMLDVPRILPCLPGARLTGREGEHTYLGNVGVKLGPVKLSFDGRAEMVRTDPATHTAWLKGSGLDPKGRGSAQSEFSFALSPEGDGTAVVVTTQLQLSGAVAQYGRGSGMIADVAAQLLKQFETNLADMLLDEQTSQPATAPVAAPTPSAGPAAIGVGLGGAGAEAAALQQLQAVLAQAQAVLSSSQRLLAEVREVHGAVRPKSSPKELNMLGIGLRAFWNSLFKRKG